MALLNIFIFLKAQTWGSPRQNSGISRLPLFIQLKMHMSQVDQRVCNGNVSVGFLQYNKHLFVHIGHANHSYSDPLLESVDIRQIYDKFPEKKGGLKELFGKGPQNAFFLVKFWVSKTLLWFQWFLSEWSRAVHWLWIHTDWSAASPSHHRLNNPGPSSCWLVAHPRGDPGGIRCPCQRETCGPLGFRVHMWGWQGTLHMAGVTVAVVRH